MHKTEKEKLFWQPPDTSPSLCPYPYENGVEENTIRVLVDYPEQGDNVNFLKEKEKEDA